MLPVWAAFVRCRVQYDRACEFWQLLIQVFAKVALYMDGKRRMKINGQMWSSHQRFFRCSVCCM